MKVRTHLKADAGWWSVLIFKNSERPAGWDLVERPIIAWWITTEIDEDKQSLNYGNEWHECVPLLVDGQDWDGWCLKGPDGKYSQAGNWFAWSLADVIQQLNEDYKELKNGQLPR